VHFFFYLGQPSWESAEVAHDLFGVNAGVEKAYDKCADDEFADLECALFKHVLQCIVVLLIVRSASLDDILEEARSTTITIL